MIIDGKFNDEKGIIETTKAYYGRKIKNRKREN